MEQEKTIAMTTAQTAAQLQISELTLLKWVKDGKVPAVRLGTRKFLFSRAEIEKLIAGNKQQPAS